MRDILFIIFVLIFIGIAFFLLPILKVGLERINEPYPDYDMAINVQFEEVI